MLFLNNDTKLLTIFKKYKVPLRTFKNVFSHNSPNKKVNIPFNPLFAYTHYSRRVSRWGSRFSRGSMTLEAAVILPFFMMTILSFLSFLDMLELHSGITMALRNVGMTMGEYGYVHEYMEDEGDVDLTGIVPNIVLSYGYVDARVNKFLGDGYLAKAKKDLGLSAIHYYNSSLMEENDVIDLVATFSVKPRFNLLGLPGINMLGRYYGRAWTGYRLDGDNFEGLQEQNVYIAKEGEVYHLSRYCTHLQITITSCVADEIHNKKNEAGQHYRPCLLCGYKQNGGKFYITSDGDCFHSVLNCSGLKRAIDVVPISMVNGRKKCSRCGG